MRPEAVDLVIHGTTLATNALIERKGARTALLTTEGFRDSIEMAYEHRFEQYDLYMERPEPLVPRELRLGVPERLASDGSTLMPLDEAAVAAHAAFFRQEGVEAVAVGFLHSYVDDSHERRAAAILRRELPEATVCLSSEVSPEIREYDRLSTTVANAYVRPLIAGYVGRLEAALRERGLGLPAAAHHVERCGDDGPDGAALPDPAGRVRPGRRRGARPQCRRRARARQGAFLRHGRHHGEDLPDRRLPPATVPQFRGGAAIFGF